MMRAKVSVFIAASLDGFIAREDGSLDWLDRANAEVPPGEDCGYHAFMDSVDVLIMGRFTYEKVLSSGMWPYGKKRVIVLSGSELNIPPSHRRTVQVSHEAPRALLDRLSTEGQKHLYVDGGITIQQFMRKGLIDEITITTIPVLLDRGRTLFGPIDEDISLTPIAIRSFPFGFVQTTYLLGKTKGMT